MNKDKQQPKDHYCPQFYLNSWVGEKNKLYSGKFIKHTSEFSWDDHAPKGTGFERGLYGHMEEKYFKPLDDKASKLLSEFLSEKILENTAIKKDLGTKNSNLWAEFIAMQIIRVPKNIRKICDAYVKAGITLEEAREYIPTVVGDKVINDIRSMQWIFANVDTNLELITCDNPAILTEESILNKNCLIILPVSPKHFFIAKHTENDQILEKNKREIVKYINKLVLKNTVKRVYARSNDSIKDSFIIRYLAKE